MRSWSVDKLAGRSEPQATIGGEAAQRRRHDDSAYGVFYCLHRSSQSCLTARRPEFSDAMAENKTMAVSVAANRATSIAMQVVNKTTKCLQYIVLNDHCEPTSHAQQLCKLNSIAIRTIRGLVWPLALAALGMDCDTMKTTVNSVSKQNIY